MRLLLDTHAWLRMRAEPEQLRDDTRSVLEDPSNELFVSAASAWEIATKHAAGRLTLPTPPDTWVADNARRSGIRELAITFAHALRAGTLPRHHRDPFDRMLVAQAQIEGLALVSADAKLAAYEVELLPA